MAKGTAKESAILAQIAFLEAEKKGEILRDVKSIPASERKSVWGAMRRRGKLVNTHCAGPGQCKKLTCFHCNCCNHDGNGNGNHTCGKYTAEAILLYEYESKVVDLIMQKCEKDSFSVSKNYAIGMASRVGFKLIPTIEAIKLDLETREATLKATGRTAFYTYQNGLMSNCGLIDQQWGISCQPELGKRTRDEAIKAMEKDETCMLEFAIKGRSSVYGSTIEKRFNCRKKVEAALQLYTIEATLRSDRSVFFHARKEDGIEGEPLDDVMKEYDRGVVAAGKINWPKGVSMKEAAGLVHHCEGKSNRKSNLPVVEETSKDVPVQAAVKEEERSKLITIEDESVSKSYCLLSIPFEDDKPLEAKLVTKKRKLSRSFSILSTVQEQEEGRSTEQADDSGGKGSNTSDEKGDVDTKGQAGLETWEIEVQAVVDCDLHSRLKLPLLYEMYRAVAEHGLWITEKQLVLFPLLKTFKESLSQVFESYVEGQRGLEQEAGQKNIDGTERTEKETDNVTERKLAERNDVERCETEQNDFYKVFPLEYYLPDVGGETVRKCNIALLHLYHDVCDGIIDDDHVPDQESIDEVIAINKLGRPIGRYYAERVIQFCSGSAALAVRFHELAQQKFSDVFREQLIDHAGPLKYELQGWVFLEAYTNALLDQKTARLLKQTADEMRMKV